MALPGPHAGNIPVDEVRPLLFEVHISWHQLTWLHLCRYLYGSMAVHAYEQAFCDLLGLSPGSEPENLQDIYENIDINEDPWTFKVGPPMPDLWKTSSTEPPDFEMNYRFLFLLLFSLF